MNFIHYIGKLGQNETTLFLNDENMYWSTTSDLKDEFPEEFNLDFRSFNVAVNVTFIRLRTTHLAYPVLENDIYVMNGSQPIKHSSERNSVRTIFFCYVMYLFYKIVQFQSNKK